MTTLSLDPSRTSTPATSVRRLAHLVLATDRSPLQALLRITLGVVMLPHGLQKTVGWFGGYGFDATMGWFGSIGIPAVLGFLAIAAESAGALALIAGFTTRIAGFGILATMSVAAMMHRANGFFMNWSGTQAGEGFEFHIVAIALALAVVVRGAGSASIDRALAARLR